MWLSIISLLGGPVVSGLIEAYKAKLAAGNTSEKIASDLAASEVSAQQAIIISEQGAWYTACIRPLLAAPFIIFTWKIVVIDKVLGWGRTDPLDPNLWTVFTAIVVAYFGGRSIEKVARILKG